MICPCKDCENKGCGVYHSKCEKYLKWVEYKRAANKAQRKSKQFAYSKYAKK